MLIIVHLGKNLLMLIILEIGTYPKSPEFKVGDRVEIFKYKNFFSKGYTKNW